LAKAGQSLSFRANYPRENRDRFIKPDGAKIGFSNDSRNRLTKAHYPDGQDKTFAYDQAGRLIHMANETTAEDREYDKDGRLLATTDKFTGRIAYRYDLLGNRISMLDPDKGAFAYVFDAANRLTSFTDPEGKLTSYSYDTLGRVVDTKLANNTGTTNSYDNDNRLAEMVTTSDKDGVLASFQYTYDGEGNKLTMTEEDGGVTSYQYDAVYRLIRVDYPDRPGQKVITAKNNGRKGSSLSLAFSMKRVTG